MSTIIQSIESDQLRQVPRFGAGDRVRVHFQVIEGARTRTQVFEGVVLKRQGSGARETFTVRKQSFGVGVERTFPLHSPKIEQLEIAARGAVRRAKLYYLRDRVGKAARVSERRWGIADEVLDAGTAGATDSEGTSQIEAEVEETTPEEGPEPTSEETSEATAEVEDAAPEEGAGPAAAVEGEAGAEGAAGEADQAGGSEGDAAEDEAPEQGS